MKNKFQIQILMSENEDQQQCETITKCLDKPKLSQGVIFNFKFKTKLQSEFLSASLNTE